MQNFIKILRNKNIYKLGLIIIFSLGILIRLYAFFRNISFWRDEACLALNIFERSYSELFKGLDYLQVAPPMFLICSKFLYSLFNPISDYFRDMVLRLIPMVSGIAAIPLFYKLINLWSNDKRKIIIALILFILNTTTILYSSQFKQYSLELLAGLILFLIFYRILFEKKFKWYYPIIIAASPWFSLSSLFIIGSYLVVLLWKNPGIILKLYSLFFISFASFYFISLKSITAVNYSGMYNWWYNGYGFVNILHPARILIRFGELFAFDKSYAFISGSLMLLVFVIAIILNFRKNITKTVFILAPITLTYTLSAFNLYPIESRLILFLYPLFVIGIADYEWIYNKQILACLCFISIVSSIYYTYKPTRFLTYTREIIQKIEKQIIPEDVIIFDSSYQGFKYYLRCPNKVVYIKENCTPLNENCNQLIESLPPGNYYLVLEKPPEGKLTSEVKIWESYSLISTFIYFNK